MAKCRVLITFKNPTQFSGELKDCGKIFRPHHLDLHIQWAVLHSHPMHVAGTGCSLVDADFPCAQFAQAEFSDFGALEHLQGFQLRAELSHSSAKHSTCSISLHWHQTCKLACPQTTGTDHKVKLCICVCASAFNNNNGNLARPTSAEPKVLTKTMLHKRENNNHNNIHNEHNQLQC